jgi:hypothetical protein
MYSIRFSKYNEVLHKVMSEEDTLEDIIDISLEKKPSKEDKKHLSDCESWAKYAFANDKVFYMTIYNNNQVIACLSYDLFSISIDFLDFQADKLIVYLSLIYDKYDINILFDENKKIKYKNGDLLLSKIISYSFEKNKNIVSEIFFKNNGLASVTVSEFYTQKNEWNTREMKTEVNISHNFIRYPNDYNDFEYLLDYKNNIRTEYFDLPDKKNKTKMELNVVCEYESVKGTPFGYFYYNIQNKNVGNFIENEPEKDFLHSTFEYIKEYFNKSNNTSFNDETVEELFDIAHKRQYTDIIYNDKYKNLQFNLSIVPPVPIFEKFNGGIFCIKGQYNFYCTKDGEKYIHEIIDINIFKNNFWKIIQGIRN